jgi:pimeloyl-ACP methyl ester carboxylesterase
MCIALAPSRWPVLCLLACLACHRPARVVHEQTPEAAPASAFLDPKDTRLSGAEAHWLNMPRERARVFVLERGPLTSAEPPLVLVHGLGPGCADYYSVLQALSQKRRVVLFDLPGFGRAERGGEYGPERYAEVLNQVIESTGREQVDLMGHSMGGAIALLYASGHRARVRRLILSDVAGILHREAFVGEQIAHSLSPVTFATPKLQEGLTESLKGLASSLRVFEPDLSMIGRFHMLDGSPEKAAAMALIQYNFGPAIRALDMPVLILWGGKDEIAPLRTAHVLSDRIAGSSLVLLANLGHTPMVEAPELTVELVERHLAQPGQVLALPLAADASTRVGYCHRQEGMVFDGAYARIELDHCRRAALHDVHTTELVIRQSDASLTHVRVDNGLIAENSDLLITGGEVRGVIALELSGSRVDAAGLSLSGSEASLRARGSSRVLSSVSPISSPYGNTVLHGELNLHDESR